MVKRMETQKAPVLESRFLLMLSRNLPQVSLNSDAVVGLYEFHIVIEPFK